DELNAACTEPGCPEVFGDAPYTLNVDTTGWNPAHGTLTLDDEDSGTITLLADQTGPIAAVIPFSVTDADQETTHAAINVTIEALAEPVAVDDARSMSAQTTLNPPGTRTLSIAVLGNDQVDASAAPIVINAVAQPANGTVTQNGQNLVYEPDLGFLGVDTFTYNVIDDHPISSNISNTATVTVTVNATSTFSGAVQNAFES